MKKVNITKGTQIVYKFKNGAKVVQILTPEAAKIEEKRMNAKFPFGTTMEAFNNTKMFSLRDRHGVSLIDMQTRPGNFEKWEEILKDNMDTFNWVYGKHSTKQNTQTTEKYELYNEFIRQLYVFKKITNIR